MKCSDTYVDCFRNTYEKYMGSERSQKCSMEGRMCLYVVFCHPGRNVCGIALESEDGWTLFLQAYLKISLLLWVDIQP